MNIRKIKEQGKAFYPVSITPAIKDLNFLKDGHPMTQEEINLQFSETLATKEQLIEDELVTAAALNDHQQRITDIEELDLWKTFE